MQKRRRMPRDPSKLSKAIIDIATGVAQPEKTIDLTAMDAGRKGGIARATRLSAKRRKAIAKAAAKARWTPSKKG